VRRGSIARATAVGRGQSSGVVFPCNGGIELVCKKKITITNGEPRHELKPFVEDQTRLVPISFIGASAPPSTPPSVPPSRRSRWPSSSSGCETWMAGRPPCLGGIEPAERRRALVRLPSRRGCGSLSGRKGGRCGRRLSSSILAKKVGRVSKTLVEEETRDEPRSELKSRVKKQTHHCCNPPSPIVYPSGHSTDLCGFVYVGSI
jgi:hypothetical protein